MSSQDILFETIEGPFNSVGLITLNRPQTLNALTQTMSIAMQKQLAHWAIDEKIKAVIIRGTGDRAFCAGGDIRQLYQDKKNAPDIGKQFFWYEYRLNHTIFNFPKPYIALMNGITMGGGVGVSIHGSHRVGTEKLIFAMPETAIGYFPDVGATYQLPRFPGYTGFYLGLTGTHIRSADAYYVGAVDHVVPSNQINELTETLIATDLKENAKQRITHVIKLFQQLPHEAELSHHRQTIDTCFNKNSIEDIMTALENQQDHWSEKTLELLTKRSPISLKMTLHALLAGKNLTFDECMQIEYRLSQRFYLDHDFSEGIRAAIIDKDQNPKWQLSSLANVDESMIEKYFGKLDKELTFS